jgi:glucose/mannose-6-phosphate isomerase
MMELDAHENFAKIDAEGMLSHALNLPQTCVDAWELAQQLYPQFDLIQRTSKAGAGLEQIVIVAMGGSAIGGDLASALVLDECPCPILIRRGYHLPAFARGHRTLVIACSHSGNTEETLSAFSQARERDTSLLAISTGGELARMAAEWDVPIAQYDYPSQPRAALGFPLMLLVNLLCQLGLISDKSADVAEAVDIMRALQAEIGPEIPVTANPAKQLAGLLAERLPVVYGAGLTEPIARRWKTQFNENAKCWAFFEAMPELNHNAVVGFEGSERIRDWGTVIFLRSSYDSPRIATRWRVTRELLLREGVGNEQVTACGQSRLAQMLSLIHYGDLVSVYLAFLTNVDPTPIGPIAYLKEELAKS